MEEVNPDNLSEKTSDRESFIRAVPTINQTISQAGRCLPSFYTLAKFMSNLI
jgi:hypothetical protein